MRILWRSSRRGIRRVRPSCGSAASRRGSVRRGTASRGARVRLRVILDREGVELAAGEALDGPSLRLTWVISAPPPCPCPSSRTAKPWFWVVISTTPVRRSLTGWLAPRWPNLSLYVVQAEGQGEQLVTEADAEHRHLAEQALHGLDGVGAPPPGRRGRWRGRRRRAQLEHLAGAGAGPGRRSPRMPARRR